MGSHRMSAGTCLCGTGWRGQNQQSTGLGQAQVMPNVGLFMALGHPLSRSWGKPSPDRRKDTPNPHLIAQVLKDSALRPSIVK